VILKCWRERVKVNADGVAQLIEARHDFSYICPAQLKIYPTGLFLTNNPAKKLMFLVESATTQSKEASKHIPTVPDCQFLKWMR